MGIVQRVQKQDAMYWAPRADKVNLDGSLQYHAPVPIKCRWDDAVQRVTNSAGIEVTVNHSLITSIPLAVGGMVVLGTKDTLTRPSDPIACGAVQVQATAITKSIRQVPSKTLYEAFA